MAVSADSRRITPTRQERIRRVLALREEGLTVKQVAREIGVSEGTIWLDLRAAQPAYGQGARRKLSERDVQRLQTEPVHGSCLRCDWEFDGDDVFACREAYADHRLKCHAAP